MKFKIIAALLFISFLLNCKKDEIEKSTIYSERFNNEIFNDKLIGKSQSEIIKILGKPLNIQKMVDFNAILYSDNPNNISFYEGFNILNFKKDNVIVKYLFFSFDKKDRVKSLLYNNYKNINEKELLGKSKVEIIGLFGKPDKTIFCNCENTILTYSDRGNGSFANIDTKMPKFYMKNIILDNKNNVVKVVAKTNNDLNRNKFGCYEK